MKKLILLFFILQLTTANTFAEGFLAMPSLWEHYQEHQQNETPGISFTDFLVMHYLNEDHAASDDEDHEHLPLKSIGSLALSSVAYSLPETLQFDLEPNSVDFLDETKDVPYQDCIITVCTDGIFQPPRL